MITWVIEEGVFDNQRLLIAEVEKQGGRVEVRDRQSLLLGSGREDLENPIVFYGSIGAAKTLYFESRWEPGPIVGGINYYDCSVYYAYWGSWMLNHDYYLVPFGDLARRIKEKAEHHYYDYYFFRANSGWKVFPSKVWVGRDFYLFYKGDLRAEEMMLYATPKKIVKEWRFIVSRKQVIAGSQYMKLGLYQEGRVEVGAREYLEDILTKVEWEPADIYIVDIGKVESYIGHTSYSVVELNCFSCSNFYGSDRSPIVSRIHELVEEYGRE